MAGRERGRPVKWVEAVVKEPIEIGKAGINIEVWTKRKRKRKKLGELKVSVGGLRWWPHKSSSARRKSWDEVDEMFSD